MNGALLQQLLNHPTLAPGTAMFYDPALDRPGAAHQPPMFDADRELSAARSWAIAGFAVAPVAISGDSNWDVHDFMDATTDPDAIGELVAATHRNLRRIRRDDLRRVREAQAKSAHHAAIVAGRRPERAASEPTSDEVDATIPQRIVPGVMLGSAGLIGLQVRDRVLARFAAAFGDLAGVPQVRTGWFYDGHARILIYKRDTPLGDLNPAALDQWGDDIELVYGEHRPMPVPGAVWRDARLWNEAAERWDDSVWCHDHLDPAVAAAAPPLPAALEALLEPCEKFARTTPLPDDARLMIHEHEAHGRGSFAMLLDAVCDPSAGIGLTNPTRQKDGTILLGLPGANGPSTALIVGKQDAPELECWTDAHPRLKRGHRYGIIHGKFADLTAAAVTTAGARTVTGGAFVLDDADAGDWWWGDGTDTIAMRGEAMVIAANTGVGKTTLAALVMAAWIGARRDALGFQVRGDGRKVLYLAMDRPRQAARALQRIFTPDQRSLLDANLVVRKGPPPAQITDDATVWAALAAEHDAGLVIVDGLKDATSQLNGDEAGLAANQAMQAVIADGRELIVLHHLRLGVGGGKPTLDDLYGSTWITAGAGSIIVLQGPNGGAARIELHHLKSPVEPVGPWKLDIDKHRGTMHRSSGGEELRRIVAAFGTNGADAEQIAIAYYGTNHDDTMLRRVKRDLERYADSGAFTVVRGKRGGKGGSQPTRYIASALETSARESKTADS